MALALQSLLQHSPDSTFQDFSYTRAPLTPVTHTAKPTIRRMAGEVGRRIQAGNAAGSPRSQTLLGWVGEGHPGSTTNPASPGNTPRVGECLQPRGFPGSPKPSFFLPHISSHNTRMLSYFPATSSWKRWSLHRHLSWRSPVARHHGRALPALLIAAPFQEKEDPHPALLCLHTALSRSPDRPRHLHHHYHPPSSPISGSQPVPWHPPWVLVLQIRVPSSSQECGQMCPHRPEILFQVKYRARGGENGLRRPPTQFHQSWEGQATPLTLSFYSCLSLLTPSLPNSHLYH